MILSFSEAVIVVMVFCWESNCFCSCSTLFMTVSEPCWAERNSDNMRFSSRPASVATSSSFSRDATCSSSSALTTYPETKLHHWKPLCQNSHITKDMTTESLLYKQTSRAIPCPHTIMVFDQLSLGVLYIYLYHSMLHIL